jgi:hypothetical protein
MTWKPGDKFKLCVPDGVEPREATIERLVIICGIAEFALHKDRADEFNFPWRVSHIPTGCRVAQAETPRHALQAAHLRARAAGASAVRAAIEGRG